MRFVSSVEPAVSGFSAQRNCRDAAVRACVDHCFGAARFIGYIQLALRSRVGDTIGIIARRRSGNHSQRAFIDNRKFVAARGAGIKPVEARHRQNAVYLAYTGNDGTQPLRPKIDNVDAAVTQVRDEEKPPPRIDTFVIKAARISGKRNALHVRQHCCDAGRGHKNEQNRGNNSRSPSENAHAEIIARRTPIGACAPGNNGEKDIEFAGRNRSNCEHFRAACG